MKRHSNLWELPNYGITEASVYLHVPVSTLRYWAVGTRADPPLVRLAQLRPNPLLSFKNLVECYVLEVIRVSHGVNLRTLRYSLKIALEKFPSAHPFADYAISTHGDHVYLDDKLLVDLSKGGQLAIRDVLGSSLRRVHRDKLGLAQRLYPYLQKKHMLRPYEETPRTVVIDPGVSFGMPVLANSRISTGFLASRYRGGDSIPMLAQDYGRKEKEIEEALVWERAKQAA